MEDNSQLDAYAARVLSELKYLKGTPDNFDAKVSALTRAYQSMGHPPDPSELSYEYLSMGSGLSGIIDTIFRALTEVLPEDIQAHIASSVRIIAAPTPDIFGFFEHDESIGSVIVLSTGFMIMLNKLHKFDAVIRGDAKIIYCNRYEVEDIGKAELAEMYRDVLFGYALGDVSGPMIIVEGAGSTVGLITQEAFVVAHELAHYLNEVIFSGAFTKLIKAFSVDPISSEAHASELAADALGAFLLRKSEYIQRLFPTSNVLSLQETELDYFKSSLICSGVCHFFEYMKLIYHNNDPTHPHPVARIENVLWWLYGEAGVQAFFDHRSGGPYPEWGSVAAQRLGSDLIGRMLFTNDRSMFEDKRKK